MKTIDQIWKKSVNLGGRPKTFNSPGELWKKALEYFKWVDENPLQEKQATNRIQDNKGEKSNGMYQNVKLTKRPYTLWSFCAFVGIGQKWADFRKRYNQIDGFSEVIYRIENIITADQVEGAIMRKYDSNLVARINTIADTTEIKGINKNLPHLSDEDIQEIIRLNEKNGCR